MRRREFVTLLSGGAASWPLAALGQQLGRRPKLGIVYLRPPAMIAGSLTVLRARAATLQHLDNIQFNGQRVGRLFHCLAWR